MDAPLSRPRRRLPERLWAWLYTGPLGHLYSVAADLSVFFVRWMAGRVRRRSGRS